MSLLGVTEGGDWVISLGSFLTVREIFSMFLGKFWTISTLTWANQDRSAGIRKGMVVASKKKTGS